MAGAELPSLTATAGDWVIFADAQTGQLDKANGHTADVIEIVEACELRDHEAQKKLKRPWWKVGSAERGRVGESFLPGDSLARTRLGA